MGAQERLGAVCVVERMLEATSLGTGDGWPVLAGVARDLAGPDDVALVLGTLVQVSHALAERLARVMETSPERILESVIVALRDGVVA